MVRPRDRRCPQWRAHEGEGRCGSACAPSRTGWTRRSDEYWAGQVAIQERAGEAWIALSRGPQREAIAAMRQAADLEDRSGKHVAMENRLSPIRELLGELLMEAQSPRRR